MYYALIQQSVVQNVALADSPSVFAGYGAVVDVTAVSPRPGPGWTWDGATFSPGVLPVVTQTTTVMSKLTFLRRFSQAERLNVRAALPTDAVVADVDQLMSLADNIDVADPDTVNYVNYLASKGLIDPSRPAAILAPETVA